MLPCLTSQSVLPPCLARISSATVLKLVFVGSPGTIAANRPPADSTVSTALAAPRPGREFSIRTSRLIAASNRSPLFQKRIRRTNTGRDISHPGLSHGPFGCSDHRRRDVDGEHMPGIANLGALPMTVCSPDPQPTSSTRLPDLTLARSRHTLCRRAPGSPWPGRPSAPSLRRTRYNCSAGVRHSIA